MKVSFKDGTTNASLPCEIAETKGKSQICKTISDGFRCVEFKGTKVDENGKDFFLGSLPINKLYIARLLLQIVVILAKTWEKRKTNHTLSFSLKIFPKIYFVSFLFFNFFLCMTLFFLFFFPFFFLCHDVILIRYLPNYYH